jgi:hypothetical protein
VPPPPVPPPVCWAPVVLAGSDSVEVIGLDVVLVVAWLVEIELDVVGWSDEVVRNAVVEGGREVGVETMMTDEDDGRVDDGDALVTTEDFAHGC